jgi:hypothetical protein
MVVVDPPESFAGMRLARLVIMIRNEQDNF